MTAPKNRQKSGPGTPVKNCHNHGQEIGGERRLGRNLPLVEGLDLLAEYLAGLRGALQNPALQHAAVTALPLWESYVRGVQERADQLIKENR